MKKKLIVCLCSFMACLFLSAVVQAYTILENGQFRLEAWNQWDDQETKSVVYLKWDMVSNLSQNGYQLYQSEDGKNWVNRSMKYGKKIDVLNIYPDNQASNTLKGWMDSLNLKAQDGQNLIQVTAVSISEFNRNADQLLKKNGQYIYDVLMFGSWDSNNLKNISNDSAKIVEKFINSGRGVLFGHDTITYETFTSFANDLKIHVFHYDPAIHKLPGINTDLRLGARKVKVINNGYLMKYPFELKDNQTLSIPYTHSGAQLTKPGDNIVWLEFIEPFGISDENNPNLVGTYINDQVYGHNNHYLLTKDNLAMIQTGHSNGQSTMDERKIIANTLYNLAQVSMDTTLYDYSVKDNVAPKPPTVKLKAGGTIDKFELEATAEDLGKNYQWYVEADTKTGGTKKSDTIQESITSDIKGYLYTIDTASGTVPEPTRDQYGHVNNLTQTVNLANGRGINIAITDRQLENKVLHIRAVDRAHNVGGTIHVPLKDYVPQFVVSEKYVDDQGQVIQKPSESIVNRGSTLERKMPPIAKYQIYQYQVDNGAKVPATANTMAKLTNIQRAHTITYFYQPLYTITERFLDQNNREIKATNTTTLLKGKTFSAQVPTIHGYQAASFQIGSRPSVAAKEGADMIIQNVANSYTVTYRYKQLFTITEKYLNQSGQEIKNTVKKKIIAGENFKKKVEALDKHQIEYFLLDNKEYKVNKDEYVDYKNVQRDLEFIYYYRTEYTVTEKYLNQAGQEIQTAKKSTILHDRDFNQKVRAISGNQIEALQINNGAKTAANKDTTASVKQVRNDLTIIYYYLTEWTITEKYLNQNAKEIKAPTKKTVLAGDTYHQQIPTIANNQKEYVLMDGTWHQAAALQTFDYKNVQKNMECIYYYRTEYTIIEEFRNQKGESIQPSKKSTILHDKAFQSKVAAINNYRIDTIQIGTAKPTSADENSKVELAKVTANQTIVYQYRQLFQVTLRLQNDQEQPIVADHVVTKADGDSYTYQPVERKGYRLDHYQLNQQKPIFAGHYPKIEITGIQADQLITVRYQRTLSVHLQTKVNTNSDQLVPIKKLGLQLGLKTAQTTKKIAYHGDVHSGNQSETFVIDRTSDQFSLELQSIVPEYYAAEKWEQGNNFTSMTTLSANNLASVENQSEIWVRRTLKAQNKIKRYSWTQKDQSFVIKQ